MKIHQIRGDVAGEKYRAFVRALLRSNEYFSLTFRPELGFAPSGSEVVGALEPLLVKQEKRNRWPGTQIFAGRVPVAYYRCDEAASRALLAVSSLFDWRAPAHPEDLAFYGARFDCSFASVAHEHEAWVLRPGVVRAVAQIVTLETLDMSAEDLALLKGVA